MQDIENSVFNTETILYKQILPESLVQDFLQYIKSIDKRELSGSLALRHRIDDIPIHLVQDAMDCLKSTLMSYFGDLEISDAMRIYCQFFGGIKPHRDMSSDGKSNVTALIYLSDGYEGGELNIKVPRTQESLKEEKEEKGGHFKFEITPKKGFGVLFHKDNLHFANEVFGDKYILLVDLYTKFL